MRLVHIKGFTVIEILVGVSLLALIVIFTTHSLTLHFASGALVQQKTKALYLAEEGQEILRYLRDEDWNAITDLTADTQYYFAVATSTVATTTSLELIDTRYTRSFVLREAYRDANDDLVASTTGGSSIDTGSYIAEVSVVWGANSVSLDGLLTNVFDI